MAVDLAPPFRDLEFMTPLSGSHVDRLVKFAATDRVVVDVGCGWAELLLRVVAAEPRCCGLGIDLDEVAIGHGRDLARERGLVGRVELRIGDAREAFPDEIGSIICVGASQIWGSQVQEGHPLDYRAALRALRKPLAVGGRLIYGEGVWTTAPTPAAIQALSGRVDEFQRLADVLDIAVSEGFRPVHVFEATQDEWDEFESGYSACYATWLSEHPPDHPDAAAVREMAKRQREGYFRGYRGVLGMAYFAFVAV